MKLYYLKQVLPAGQGPGGAGGFAAAGKRARPRGPATGAAPGAEFVQDLGLSVICSHFTQHWAFWVSLQCLQGQITLELPRSASRSGSTNRPKMSKETYRVSV